MRLTLGQLTTMFALVVSIATAQADVVKVGITTPLSGFQQGVGTETVSFWEAFAKHAENKGLLKSHKLQIVALDDAFDAKKSTVNAQKLIDDGAVVLTGAAGIPSVLAMIPVLENTKVALLSPNSGAAELRGKSPAVFHTKPSFVAEVGRAADVLGSMGADKFVLITDDVPGRKLLIDQFAQRIRGKGSKTELLKTLIIAQKDGNIASTINEAVALKPSGIFLMIIPGLVPTALTSLQQASYSGLIATWSVSATDQVVKAASESGRSVIFTSVVPAPTNLKLNISKNFASFCKEFSVKPTFRGMEAYVSALLLVDALNRIPGRVTRQSVWTALENTRNLDLGGITISYPSGTREGSEYLDIVVLSRDGRFRY
jgi:branched-chain amino acid transport system substrate-binding protein